MTFKLIEISSCFGKRNVAKHRDGSVNYDTQILKFYFNSFTIDFISQGVRRVFLFRYGTFRNGFKFEINLFSLFYYDYTTFINSYSNFNKNGELIKHELSFRYLFKTIRW